MEIMWTILYLQGDCFMNDINELRRLQSLPLDEKITLTKLRIQEWYEHWGGAVFVSFSGGKDSTVLLKLVRELYPDVKAVFCDTGLEYPEIKQHVKSFDNVEIIRPKKSFKQVVEEYGWVFPSKAVAEKIYYAKKGKQWAINHMNGLNTEGTPSAYNNRICTKWKFLIDAPFKISKNCCYIMKKAPFHSYVNKNHLYQYLGMLADEGQLRENLWLKEGCNGFSATKYKSSRPLMFWTEQDILQYIYENNVKIPSVYGEVIKQDNKYSVTGVTRTGCIFCPISCHLDNRFQQLHKTHPKLWEYVMNQLHLKEFLDYVGEQRGKKISYY